MVIKELSADWIAIWLGAFWKMVLRLQKLITELPYNPVILLLNIYTKKIKIFISKDICIFMLITPLFSGNKI